MKSFKERVKARLMSEIPYVYYKSDNEDKMFDFELEDYDKSEDRAGAFNKLNNIFRGNELPTTGKNPQPVLLKTTEEKLDFKKGLLDDNMYLKYTLHVLGMNKEELSEYIDNIIYPQH